MTTEEVKALIQAVDKADSADELLEAVKALAAVRHEVAIPKLIEVLGYNNPGAAVAAVDGLIDIGEVAVSYILEKLDGYNYGARAWATRVLAGIGDPRALDLLLDAASNDFSLSVRRAAAKGLGSIRWPKLSSEDVLQAQMKVLDTLLVVSQDPEWVVRYGAVVGLQSLWSATAAVTLEPQKKILERFEEMLDIEPELVVRVRIQLAIAQLN
ncbi:HEAT repeat domain-containing protein [Candidatus Gracilibacteria bacterium]|nr:HEAT repeat domain-containing protein [Candidatus Gracilibacteria bacterium]NJM88048.1 HEAT repeat domain-containing protein [Hydrococcus sp. RU_2_2]NJP19510.1 HEAT repeat domain-containing protein [Hydrococcus sp. CRU_1_1]